MPFSLPNYTTSLPINDSLTFRSFTPYFIIDVVSAILATFFAQCDHAAILAILAILAFNLIPFEHSVTPNTLVRGENLVEYRHCDVHRFHKLGLVNSLTNRLLRYAPTYRIPRVVYSASILHITKSPIVVFTNSAGNSK